MGIQTITTPAGEEMVVMPRAEYEALVTAAEEAFEDGADVAAYSAAIAALQPEDVLPPDLSAAILKGVGRVRAFREWRGLSGSELASASGLSETELDDLESGRRVLSREWAAGLSQALNLPVGWLAA